MSIAAEALRMTGLFEAELLVELMLRYWEHPCRDDAEFRGQLLESAAEALRAAVAGAQLLEGVEPAGMNLVAAVWYAEASQMPDETDANRVEVRSRRAWLQSLRRAAPSCFCDPEYLP